MRLNSYFVAFCICLPLLVNCNIDYDFTNSSDKTNSDVSFLKNANYSDYRLPTNLKPTWYDLRVLPFFNNSTFMSNVTIQFDVINATNSIVINGIASTPPDSFKADVISSDPVVKITKINFDNEHEMILFLLNDTLPPQSNVSLHMNYFGQLGLNNMVGFYMSTYNTTDASGVLTEHKMATTQFEGTYARRAFPCFDEPAYRASFTVSIYRAPNHTSLSNMNLSTSTYDTGLGMFLDTYEPTPSMPTYLVAFAVSDLDYISDQILRVFARPSVIQDAEFTLSVGKPVLDYISDYVNVSYPLPKMDIVTVPDFSAGAMENWGLTTFREKYILYNQKKNTHKDLYGVLSVVAHEFGHQWFGDLVTPLWWDYTWLNEAFATYFEYTIPNQVAPEWNINSTMYVVSAVQYALNLDTGSPRPMTSPVYTPDQIENIFDYVIYEKGGSVLRMIENFLTTPVWKDGLHRYLSKNAYGTGTPAELFSALEAAAYAANSPVASRVVATLLTWTTQPGYPLVKIHKEQGSTYLITQSPYELTSTPDQRWSIPLTFTTQEQAQFDATKANRTLLYTTGDTININTTGWMIFNIEECGFYRVNYEDENWGKLTDQLKSNYSHIGTINRAQLIDDVFHLARSGHLNYSTALRLASYLPQENQFAPFNAFFTNMGFLINQFYNTPIGDDLLQYAREIMASPFKAITSNITNSASTFLSSMVLLDGGKFSCNIQLPECENLALAAFDSWQKNPYGLPPDVREAVICTKLRLDSSGKSFQSVLDYTLNSDNGAEQLTLFNAMGCVTNEAAINMYLNVICDINANHVRLQDRWVAFGAVLSHQSGINPGLQYIVNNYNNVNQALGDRINYLFSTLGRTISQGSHIDQLKKILNDTKVDPDLRDKLSSLVLPPVMKRQSWAQSSQAIELKTSLNNYLRSSASSLVGRATLILALASFLMLRL